MVRTVIFHFWSIVCIFIHARLVDFLAWAPRHCNDPIGFGGVTTPMEAEEILIYIKSPQNKSVWHFSSNLDVPSNVVQKKRVARIMFFKIRPSQKF
ncbi:hypothetical protein OROMI_001953 [Orobanche minor]